MKVLLDIKDNRAPFLLELLNKLPYVKTHTLTPYKAEVLAGLAEAVTQVKLAKQGKIKLKSARELLDEI